MCLHGSAETGETLGGVAQVMEGFDVLGFDLGGDFLHEIGDQGVEHLLKGFVGEQTRVGVWISMMRLGVHAGEERDLLVNVGEVQDAGGETVFEVGGEVGDFVGDVDELGFERRLLIEEILGQLGKPVGWVVAGVLDDAFANAEGEVEAAEPGVAFFEGGDDAQGVQVVIEAEAVGAQGFVEGCFPGVAKGRMADVVDQGQRLSQGDVEPQSGGYGAGDLGDFEGVGETAAGVIAFRGAASKDLGLAGKAAKGLCMENTRGVPGKR